MLPININCIVIECYCYSMVKKWILRDIQIDKSLVKNRQSTILIKCSVLGQKLHGFHGEK